MQSRGLSPLGLLLLEIFLERRSGGNGLAGVGVIPGLRVASIRHAAGPDVFLAILLGFLKKRTTAMNGIHTAVVAVDRQEKPMFFLCFSKRANPAICCGNLSLTPF